MRKNSKQISSGLRNYSQNSYEQSFGVNPEQYQNQYQIGTFDNKGENIIEDNKEENQLTEENFNNNNNNYEYYNNENDDEDGDDIINSLYNYKEEKNDVEQYNKEDSNSNKIYLIFINNAIYIPEKNKYLLSQQSLYKMIKEISFKLNINQIDLIFKKISPKSLQIDYEQFEQFLILLCQKEYSKEFQKDKKTTMNNFLQNIYDKYNTVIKEETSNNKNDPSNYLYNSMKKLFDYTPNKSQFYIIEQINSTINEIYERYFNDGTKDENYVNENSLRSLIEFSRDFEIIPYIVTESQMSTYFFLSNENESQDKSPQFGINNFILLLVRMSVFFYEKNYQNSNVNCNEVRKLLIFLEKLEYSKGMNNFTRKLNRPSAKRLSLIPNKQIYLELNEKNEDERKNNNKIKDNLIFDFNLIENNKLINNNINAFETTFSYFCSQGNKLNYKLMSYLSYVKFLKHCKLYKEFSEEEKIKFNKISKQLVRKNLNENAFSYKRNKSQDNYYPSSKEKEYKNTINKIVNSSNKNNNLKLGESEITIIFSLLTGPRNYNLNDYYQNMLDKNSGYSTSIWNNNEKKFNTKAINNNLTNENNKNYNGSFLKMDFKTFLLSFIFISQKLFPNQNAEKALNCLLEKKIIPNLIYNDKNIINTNKNQFYFDNLEKIYQTLKDEEYSFCIQKLKQVIGMYSKNYFDSKNINFNKFLSFYTDFSIFPDFINLLQIKTLFGFLCQKTKLEENKNYNSIKNLNNKNEYVNYNLFSISFAIIAMINNLNDNFIYNLVGLIEKMNFSLGIKKSILKSGRTYTKSSDFVSFLEAIRNKYPQFFNINYNDNDNNNKNKNLMTLKDIFGDEE